MWARLPAERRAGQRARHPASAWYVDIRVASDDPLVPRERIRAMGFFDRLFGRRQQPQTSRTPSKQPQDGQPPDQPLTDEQAIDRYKYMLRTAPPDAIEQAHEEAFAKLTPEQRRLALEQLSAAIPEYERTGELRDDPHTLAHMATRAEVRQPGTLVNLFGRSPSASGAAYGGGVLGGFGGTLLSSIAGAFIGTMVADALFNHVAYDQGYADGARADAANDQQDGGDASDQGTADTQTMDEAGGESGAADAGGQQDWVGEYGDDLGSDLGGGDFGAGDF